MDSKCNAMLTAGFTVVFYNAWRTLPGMSLNRSEQLLYDYVHGHKDERQHLENKVQAIAASHADVPEAVARIDAELWRYYEERSSVAPVFVAAARAHGLKRTSMKNLAELLVRLWTEPKPKKPARPGPESAP
jgi:hypothetical protein